MKSTVEAKRKRQTFLTSREEQRVEEGCQAVRWCDWKNNSSRMRKSLQVIGKDKSTKLYHESFEGPQNAWETNSIRGSCKHNNFPGNQKTVIAWHWGFGLSPLGHEESLEFKAAKYLSHMHDLGRSH